MPEDKNIFFSYGVSEDNGGFYVVMYNLDRRPHDVCFTKSKKVADYLEKHFDNLAMDEEKDLFEGLKENDE